MSEIVMLGGPNGAGKTTTARVLLPEFFELDPFLNADEIGRVLSPADPEHAALRRAYDDRKDAGSGA